MNKVQNSKYNMYLAVLQVCNANQLVWQVLLAFVTAMADLTNNVDLLEASLQAQQRIITGYARDKQAARDGMTAQAMTVKGAIQAYATDTQNDVLYNSVNFSATKLKYGKASDAQTRAQIICDAGTANLADLGSYGLTSQVLGDLQTAIDRFANLIAQPRDAKSSIVVATANVKQLITAIDTILEKRMDKLMDNFKVSNPDFYAQYFNNRKLILNVRHTTFHAVIKDIRGNPVEGAEVYIIGTSHSGTSDINGVCMIEPVMPYGLHEVSITAPGFESIYGPLMFRRGKTVTEYFQIGPEEAPEALKGAVSKEVPEKSSVAK